jgi:hypothetical protein
MAYALLDDKIYLFSGLSKYDEGGTTSASTMIYDISEVMFAVSKFNETRPMESLQ